MRGPKCKGCILQTIGGSGYVEVEGEAKNGVLILLEAPGEEEAKESRPLAGKTGSYFNKLLASTEDPQSGKPFNREDFAITNVIRCRPPGNELTNKPWEKRAVDHCRGYLEETLERIKPKVILACGNQALRWLTGHWGVDKENLRGYVFPSKWGPVVATYHPSYIIRGKFHLGRVWLQDLKKALYVARFGLPKATYDYLLDPSYKEMIEWRDRYFEALKRDPSTTLAFDIETPYGGTDKDDELGDNEWSMVNDAPLEEDITYTILRASLSYKGFSAISFPWCRPFNDLAREMLASEGPKTVWNGNYDIPRLRHNECPIGGRIYDSMFAWHFYEPVLPMGLKYAATFYCPDLPAWHLESTRKPAYYSAVDSDALLRCFEGIKRDLISSSRWERFERHVIDLEKVLSKMSSRGILVDKEKRREAAEEFSREFDSVCEKLQGKIPLSLIPKQVFKLSEERLRKSGSWEEGKMIQVKEWAKVKEKKEKPPKPPKSPKPVKEKAAKPPRKSRSKSSNLKEEKLEGMLPSAGSVSQIASSLPERERLNGEVEI